MEGKILFELIAPIKNNSRNANALLIDCCGIRLNISAVHTSTMNRAHTFKEDA